MIIAMTKISITSAAAYTLRRQSAAYRASGCVRLFRREVAPVEFLFARPELIAMSAMPVICSVLQMARDPIAGNMSFVTVQDVDEFAPSRVTKVLVSCSRHQCST